MMYLSRTIKFQNQHGCRQLVFSSFFLIDLQLVSDILSLACLGITAIFRTILKKKSRIHSPHVVDLFV